VTSVVRSYLSDWMKMAFWTFEELLERWRNLSDI